jgi:uncharacterized membrane protein
MITVNTSARSGYRGRSLSLGLEFLVAADLIRTVTMALTLTNIETLGANILTVPF